jgi:hypothetical protein
MDAGCLPASIPVAGHRNAAFAGQQAVRDVPPEAGFRLPIRVDEIWTPPD